MYVCVCVCGGCSSTGRCMVVCALGKSFGCVLHFLSNNDTGPYPVLGECSRNAVHSKQIQITCTVWEGIQNH